MASSPRKTLEILEKDETGNVTATYVESRSLGKDSKPRIDVILPEKQQGIWHNLIRVFLPSGFPNSVTEDYVKYQIYDSLQAFSSSIAGLLSSRAVLEGVGVGDASASPTTALLFSILQDSMGRIATILFAHKLGTSLEAECKMYRLAADVFNDAAMILDCLSPVFARPMRVMILTCSSVLRALCGVAAGSAKASLSAHFARWGNLGELNAKDSSQETVISLLGMLAGSVVVQRVSSPAATWTCLVFLLAIHLITNYAAVRAVQMRTLNRQRANIVFSELIGRGTSLSPKEVSRREHVFEHDAILRWDGREALGFCYIGVSLRSIADSLCQNKGGSRSIDGEIVSLRDICDLFEDEQYLLWYDANRSTALITLKEGTSTGSQLKAWCQALIVAQNQKRLRYNSRHEIFQLLADSLKFVNGNFGDYLRGLKATGWEMETAALQTHSSRRVVLEQEQS